VRCPSCCSPARSALNHVQTSILGRPASILEWLGIWKQQQHRSCARAAFGEAPPPAAWTTIAAGPGGAQGHQQHKYLHNSNNAHSKSNASGSADVSAAAAERWPDSHREQYQATAAMPAPVVPLLLSAFLTRTPDLSPAPLPTPKSSACGGLELLVR